MKDLINKNLTELESPTPESVIADGAIEGLKANEKNMVIDINKVGNAPEMDEKPPVDRPQMALDDTSRLKVLSPSMLVFKRFIRNKLAIIGCFILLFMFSFSFVGGWIIPYKQAQVFNKYDIILFDYATATERENFENYYIADKNDIHFSVRNMLNSHIKNMEASGATSLNLRDDLGKNYVLTKSGDKLYALNAEQTEKVATFVLRNNLTTYNSFLNELGSEDIGISNISGFKAAVSSAVSSGEFTFAGKNYIVEPSGTKNTYNIIEIFNLPKITYEGAALGTEFENALNASFNKESFSVSGVKYLILKTDKLYTVKKDLGKNNLLFASTFVFDCYEKNIVLDTDFKLSVFNALYTTKNFVYNSNNYNITTAEGLFVVNKIVDGVAVPFANMSTFVARRYNGEDTLSIDFKKQLQEKVAEMIKTNVTEGKFIYYMQLLDEKGVGKVDEEGKPVMGEEKFEIKRELNNFVLKNFQEKYLIDIYGNPSKTHLLGTDSNGMDVLARIMYGGRISLTIGFIVIFLELIIGVVLGGIAGYFGKWIDNLIMRLVDIFNCIPSLPLLIIMGSYFDSIQMDSYTRIMWLMIVLGVLGWPGIARLVRGQILSLREQEFMIAAEATGLTANRRIFKHLIPNVMPQLIVNATMGLGGIILTESTLSFLGLGAKFPLATWGAIINSVSSAAAMVKYTYIWIPVGALICLTVIAFNFVGDGLRDAFDPKMKR